MISEDTDWICCDRSGCPAKVRNHRWGATTLVAQGWTGKVASVVWA